MEVEPGNDYPWNALILDSTNLTPALLNYNVLDTSPKTNRNLSYSQGTVLFWYAPNWSSISQGGTGPGQTAYFVAGGDWSTNSPNGLFAIYAERPARTCALAEWALEILRPTPASRSHGVPTCFIKSVWNGLRMIARFIWMVPLPPRETG